MTAGPSTYLYRSMFNGSKVTCTICQKTESILDATTGWTEIKIEVIGQNTNRYLCLCPDHSTDTLNVVEHHIARIRHAG